MKKLILAASVLPMIAIATPFLPVTAHAQSVTIGNDDRQILNVLRRNGYREGRILNRGLTIVRAEGCKGSEKFLLKVNVLGRITGSTVVGTCGRSRAEPRRPQPTPRLAGRFTAQDAFQRLQVNGYTNIQVENKGRGAFARACESNQVVELVYDNKGEVLSRAIIGKCGANSSQGPGAFTPQQAFDRLRANGYQDIRTEERGNGAFARACESDKIVELIFNDKGQVASRAVKGPCVDGNAKAAQVFSAQDARKRLAANGYTNIRTDARGNGASATACESGKSVELIFNPAGQIQSRAVVGQCGNTRQTNVANRLLEALEERGYSRIEVIDDQPPRYVVEACRGNERLELRINRRGEIVRERRRGRCRNRLEASELTSSLERRGYNRIKVVRGDRAPFIVEACQGNRLKELGLNRFGEIRRERNVGTCASAVTEDQLRERYSREGFVNIRLERNSDNWSASMCNDDQEITRLVNAYGETLRESKSGSCTSRSVLRVLKTLERRGAEDVELSVTGCYRGTKYRWDFNRLGYRTGRERIGNC